MGIVGSKIIRSFRRFNVESRTEKILARDKPIPAPHHPTNEQPLQELYDGESIKKSLTNKNLQLDSYLKDVYVTSTSSSPNKSSKYGKPSEKVRMPQHRGLVEDTMLGYVEPDNVPAGKITLHKVMQFLADSESLNKTKALEAATTQYKLNPSNAENILKYFGCFEVHISDKKTLGSEDSKKKILPEPRVIETIEGVTKK